MTGTVIRVFEKIADAEAARKALLSSGFPADTIELASREDETGPMGEGDFRLPAENVDEPGATAKSHPRERINSEAVRRGSLLLTVVTDDDRTDLAGEIMDRYHAIDADRRASRHRPGY